MGRSKYSNNAEFSAPATLFGEALIHLIDDHYEDAEEAISDLQEVTGLSEDDVLDLIEGLAVPDEELTSAIGSMFELTAENEDSFEDLLDVASLSRQDAYGYDPVYEELEDEDEIEAVDEEDEEEDEYEDEDEEAQYSAIDSRYAALENKIVEFELEKEVKTALANIERKANQGVQEGWLPPVAHRALLGSFEREEDRLAKFSELCDANGVDLNTQLVAFEFALKVFEHCGPMVQFGQVIQEDLDPRQAEFQSNLEDQAVLNFQLWKENK